MKRLLLFLMLLALAIPLWAGEKTVTISRNEGTYDDGTGVYYCTKGGITMTFSSGLNNVNYLVEHQQTVFDIFSTNYTIKKIVFHCLDNTTSDQIDSFYWGPSTISEFDGANYTPTGTYSYSGYDGTWVGGSTPSKYVKFQTMARPVRFGSVEITVDKELGDIYDLVTSNDEIEAGQTYVLVSQRSSRALGREEYHGSDAFTTFSSTPVTLLNGNQKVKVTDEVQLIKLESSGDGTRPWYLKVGENYMRRRNGTNTSGSGTNYGYNLYSTANISSGTETNYRVSISVTGNTNNNALIRFTHNNSETTAPSGGVTRTFAIRHYNGGSLFRVMDYSSNNDDASYQRVYLYKPAENHIVTTECDPTAGGYITLGDGVLMDNQGVNRSQQYETVTFFVGSTDGWGVGEVTVTNQATGEVTTLVPTGTSDFGNDYTFTMPDADVHIVARFNEPHVIHTQINPAEGGSFNFINGYTDFNGQTTSNAGKTVTFTVDPADGYEFNSLTLTDDVTGAVTTLTPDANGVFSFVMPDNDVTLSANFDLIPSYVITTECLPVNGGQINVHTGVTTVDNVITGDVGDQVTFWVGVNSGWVIDGVTAINQLTNEPVALTEVHADSYGKDYQFTMPVGNVHIVATFRPADDGLYLLGTANGRTGWVPYGPKFIYDPANDNYYLDVYFKGGNDDPNTDPAYGYFSLTKVIDEGGNWDNISGHRLAAEYDLYGVQDGSTGVTLYSGTDHQNFAFKIPPGVYRITVNNAKTEMSITEYPLELYFNPASGSTVELGQVVTITSNLDQLVHDINENEVLATFKNSTDGTVPPVTEGNTATITQQGTTTVNATANIGYIVVPGTATYTLAGPQQYSITALCSPAAGGSITVIDQATAGETVNVTVGTNLGYSLTSVTVTTSGTVQQVPVTDNGDGTYSFTMPEDDVVVMANFSLEGVIVRVVTKTSQIVEGQTYVYINRASQQVMSKPINSPNYFYDEADIVGWVSPGDFSRAIVDGRAVFFKTVNVNDTVTPAGAKAVNLQAEDGMYITMRDLSDGFNVGGRMYPYPTLSSDDYMHQLQRLTMMVEPTGTDYLAGSIYSHYLAPNSYRLSFAGSEFCFITDNPTHPIAIHLYKIADSFNISTETDPDGAGELALSGDVTGTTCLDGDVVTVTPSSNDDYVFDHLTVTVDDTGEVIDVVDNQDGTYSFEMPVGDVTVTGHYVQGFKVSTVCVPAAGGVINGIDFNYAPEGKNISFNVVANDYYVLDHVTLTNHETGEVTVLDMTGYDYNEESQLIHAYAFEMPAADVTLTAYFNAANKVTCVVLPDDGDNLPGDMMAVRELDNGEFMWSEYFAPGTDVLVDIYQYPGYALDHVTAIKDGTEVEVELNDISEEIDDESYEAHYYKSFVMPANDVTVTAYFVPYTPLKLIEDYDYGNGNGDEVVVSDTLIVVWAAKDMLWAKDMARSNVYEEQPEGTRDYIKTDLKLQTHDWDQSNWVMLDCSALYPELTTVQRREKLNELVDHKIVPSTIRGIYYCEFSDRDYKVGHTIVLSDEHRPQPVPYLVNDVQYSLGYPGYIQDPREENQNYDYSYNHYIPTNFLCRYSIVTAESDCVFNMGQDQLTSLTEDIQFFFIPPKDKEVVQVWAVYEGASDGDVPCDFFTMYKPYKDNGIQQNIFDLPGFFHVDQDDWCYNRLRTDLTDDAFGRPGNIDGLDTPLNPGDAYLFHVAIEHRWHEPVHIKAPATEPNTPQNGEYNDTYRVLPLDMDSPDNTYTAVKTINAPDAAQIVSISYFNMMGQESSQPFDGVNIMVIRYKDGSFRSTKILK